MRFPREARLNVLGMLHKVHTLQMDVPQIDYGKNTNRPNSYLDRISV